MKQVQGIGLSDVQKVYDGPEGQLWELVMGQQIHIGGFISSMDLADKAGIASGAGVDLCCCNGAGMRFLVRYRNVERMTGVDATVTVIEQGRQRCRAEGSDHKISFVQADVCSTGLPGASADFVWGEDAWCYVADKPKLIAEAARLVKSRGKIAFTDWVEGPAGLSGSEAQQLLKFMKFPSIESIPGYAELLTKSGCKVLLAEDTGRFAPYCDLYIKMLNMQLAGDALRIIGHDTALLQTMGQEMVFMHELACAGKIAQGLFVAQRV